MKDDRGKRAPEDRRPYEVSEDLRADGDIGPYEVSGSGGRGIIGEDGEEYITQRQYAALHGVSASSVHLRAVRGLLPVMECGGYKLVKKSAPYPELKPGPLKREKMRKLQCSISVCSIGICCKQCQYRTDCADICLNSPERCGCAVEVKGGAK